jgi:hypothetical protein
MLEEAYNVSMSIAPVLRIRMALSEDVNTMQLGRAQPNPSMMRPETAQKDVLARNLADRTDVAVRPVGGQRGVANYVRRTVNGAEKTR